MAEMTSYADPGRQDPQPKMLASLSPYPAVQYAPEDLLGFNVLTGARALNVGSWYKLSGGGYAVTLPALSAVKAGDAVLIATDGNAAASPYTLAAQGADLIRQAAGAAASLSLNADNDRFWVVKGASDWEIT